MRALRAALAFAALAGCAEPPLLLPETPAGATAVAVIGEGEGVVAPLPLAAAIELSEGALVAHYFKLELTGPSPISRGEGCDEAGLGEPLASFSLGASGPTPRPGPQPALRAPGLACAARELVLVGYEGIGCTRPTFERAGCALHFDTLPCGGEEESDWPVELDGRVCGPRASDASCEPARAPPPASLAAATCADASYAVYALEPLELELEEVDLSSVRASHPGGVVDLVASPDEVIGALSRALDNDLCEGSSVSALFRFDRRTRVVTASVTPLPCVVHLTRAHDALWAIFRPDATHFGLSRLDARGAVTASVSVPIPAALLDASIRSHEVTGLVDTSLEGQAPELTLVINAISRVDPHESGMAILGFDATTLAPRAPIVAQASPQDVVRDGAELFISDDSIESIEIFRLPLVDPLTEASTLKDDRSPTVTMGPLLVARDLGLYLVGRAGDYPGLDVFTGRGQRHAPASASFVRAVEAGATSLVRVDRDRALAVFVEIFRQRPESEADTWITALDLREPERVVPGVRAALLFHGTPCRARGDGTGVTWVAQRYGPKLLGIRLP